MCNSSSQLRCFVFVGLSYVAVSLVLEHPKGSSAMHVANINRVRGSSSSNMTAGLSRPLYGPGMGSSAPRVSTVEFIGRTSAAAVYAESGIDFEHLENSHMSASHLSPASPAFFQADPESLKLGAEILGCFGNTMLFKRLIQHQYDVDNDAIALAPLTENWMEAISRSLNDAAQNSAKLLNASAQIFSNSSVSLDVFSVTTSSKCAALLSSLGLRWEVVGILLAIVGRSIAKLPDRHPLLVDPMGKFVNRAYLANELVEACNACLGFCDKLGINNDLSAWLLYESLAFLAVAHGESSMTHSYVSLHFD